MLKEARDKETHVYRTAQKPRCPLFLFLADLKTKQLRRCHIFRYIFPHREEENSLVFIFPKSTIGWMWFSPKSINTEHLGKELLALSITRKEIRIKKGHCKWTSRLKNDNNGSEIGLDCVCRGIPMPPIQTPSKIEIEMPFDAKTRPLHAHLISMQAAEILKVQQKSNTVRLRYVPS